MSAQATISSLRVCWHADKATAAVRVLHLISEPRSWQFFTGQAAYFRGQGFEVHAASSPGRLLEKFGRDNEVAVHPVPISRRLSIGSDLVSVWRVLRILREVRPQILHAHFSKPGIIGMVAGFLARTPVRIYHNHGMALSSAHGWKRLMLWIVETLACLLAHRVIYVAPSVLHDAVRLGVCTPRKARAILSANGLDFSHRFTPLLYGADHRHLGRRSLQIPDDAFVVGYVGRIFKIKGIEDLVKAWQLLSQTEPRLHIIMVGDFDPREPIALWAQQVVRSDSKIHLTGFVEEPATVYPMMDVVVLPSYHEGLGYSMVEAAAMELPVIGTRIPGIVDALQENVNGLLTAPGKPQELAKAIRRYIHDPVLASAHGKAGREFVVEHFRHLDVCDQIRETYNELIEQRIVHGLAVVDDHASGETG